MKNFKKITALFLSLILFFGLICPCHADNGKINYLLLGDSIAKGAGIYNSSEACYGRIVADTNGYDYANYAVNGHRTTDLLSRLNDQTVISAVEEADIISISIGGNNFLQQNLPQLYAEYLVHNEKTVNDIEEIFFEEFSEIMEIIKTRNPDALILMQTLYNPRSDLLRNFYDLAVIRINRSIYRYLDENPGAFEIIDVHSVFTADHPEYIALDTIHPSAVGNEVIAELITDKISELNASAGNNIIINKRGIDQIPFMSRVLKFFRDIIQKIIDLFDIA